MNRKELLEKLNKMKVPKSFYSLEGGLENERLCLEYYDNNWLVYYVEKGVKNELESFDYEDEACDFLLNAIQEIIDGKY